MCLCVYVWACVCLGVYVCVCVDKITSCSSAVLTVLLSSFKVWLTWWSATKVWPITSLWDHFLFLLFPPITTPLTKPPPPPPQMTQTLIQGQVWLFSLLGLGLGYWEAKLIPDLWLRWGYGFRVILDQGPGSMDGLDGLCVRVCVCVYCRFSLPCISPHPDPSHYNPFPSHWFLHVDPPSYLTVFCSCSF